MRPDSIGLFWQDIPPVKVVKEKVKLVPPERTWERPDYLPGLEEALAFNVPLFGQEEFFHAGIRQHELLFDVEVYPNFFFVGMVDYVSGKVAYFESSNLEGEITQLNIQGLRWAVEHFKLTGFNSWNYDAVMMALALAGASTDQLHHATQQIIVYDERPRDVLNQSKVKTLKFNHIDLIEVAPLRASLKIYGGRLHVPRMQDLPFKPGTVLTKAQAAIVRWYNVADLTSTAYLRRCLQEQLTLRETLGQRYKLDLRSRSDAQIAEAVIAKELEQLNGKRPVAPEIPPGTSYKYQPPAFLQYQTETMRWVLARVCHADFVVGGHGAITTPPELNDFTVQIAAAKYRMGIGGLHSTEECAAHVTDKDYIICDRDVASYYPAIILNLNLYPQHLGIPFLHVYRQIVNQRLEAKRRGDKATADSLKITVNGAFGKLGNAFSILYAPDLLTEVTLTGQLALLMLIERLELVGIQVISANTDGVTMKCLRSMEGTMLEIVKGWERDTGFETEETRYMGLYSRDVNNYIAVKQKYDKEAKRWIETPDGVKTKGVFNNPWADKKASAEKLHKNPVTTVCIEAVQALLTHGTPLETTVNACQDVTKFVEVRHVRHGAVKDGVYLGKSVRWYYAEGETGHIINAATGGKVPRSQGARPLMELPTSVPPDLDRAFYVARAIEMLQDIGFEKKA